jgi:hypothetical protein
MLYVVYCILYIVYCILYSVGEIGTQIQHIILGKLLRLGCSILYILYILYILHDWHT